MKSKSGFIFLVALCLYLGLQMPFLTVISKVWVDEPWYGGTAYNFSQFKGFTNENVVGMYGGDVIFGYPLMLGSFMRIFGGSLFTARLFSVLCGLLLLVIARLILQELKVGLKGISAFYILFILSSTVYIAFRTIRPEAVKIVFSSLSLLFLLKGIYKNPRYLFFSGASIAFASLCHPDEIMFFLSMTVIMVVLSFRRKTLYPALLFVIGGAFIALIFVLFLYGVKDMTIHDFYLYYGRRLSAYNGSMLGSFSLKAKNLFGEYALGIKRIYILLFEVGIFAAGAFFFRRNKKILLLTVIGGGFFLLSFVFLERIVTRGFISIIFYSLLVYALMIQENSKNKLRNKIVFFAGVFYLLNNVLAVGYLVARDMKNTPYSIVEKFIDERVEDRKKVLSHINYYFPLKNNELYNDYTIYKLTKAMSLDNLLQKDDIDYAVLSEKALAGETGTSGRTEKKESVDDFNRFYYKANKYAHEKMKLLDTLATKGYGTIYIYIRK